MGETAIHVRMFEELMGLLTTHYREDSDVSVIGNMFVYYREGEPRQVVCPDIFLVRGVVKDPGRRVFKTWEEGRSPHLIIELTSEKTRSKDLKEKKLIYEHELATPEYALFDPCGEYLTPRLQAFRLESGKYQEVALADGRFRSENFSLELSAVPDEHREWHWLRIYDARNGRSIPYRHELQAEVERLRNEIQALRKRK